MGYHAGCGYAIDVDALDWSMSPQHDPARSYVMPWPYLLEADKNA